MAAEENTYRAVGLFRSSVVGEIELTLQNLEPNEQIDLILHMHDANYRGFFWNLQLLILEKRKNIHCFDIRNDCQDNDKYSVVLDYFIRFILNNNETTHFQYFSWDTTTNRVSMNLDRSRQLAEALRSNNRGQVQTFTFVDETFMDQEGVQLVWDALHVRGVQDLAIDLKLPSDNDDNNNNNNNNNDDANYDDDDNERETIDPTFDLVSVSDNTTLKKLDITVCPFMSKCINMPIFFDVMTTKEELWSLEMNIHNDDFRKKERVLVKDMLLHNHSLTKIRISDEIDTGNIMVGGGSDHDEQNAITTLLNINREWNTYKAMLPVLVPADADEVETAKRSKVRALVKMYVNTKINKPILHATITFILLNEYGLVVVSHDDENTENGIYLRPIYFQRDEEDVMFMQLPLDGPGCCLQS